MARTVFQYLKNLTKDSRYPSDLVFKFLNFYILRPFLDSCGMNPWYSKTLETLPLAFDARWNLAIVILERMQAHSSSCRPTSALSSLRTKAPFLIPRHLGPTFPSNFFRALMHTYIYAPPTGIARRIFEYEDGGIYRRYEGEVSISCELFSLSTIASIPRPRLAAILPKSAITLVYRMRVLLL